MYACVVASVVTNAMYIKIPKGHSWGPKCKWVDSVYFGDSQG